MMSENCHPKDRHLQRSLNVHTEGGQDNGRMLSGNTKWEKCWRLQRATIRFFKLMWWGSVRTLLGAINRDLVTCIWEKEHHHFWAPVVGEVALEEVLQVWSFTPVKKLDALNFTPYLSLWSTVHKTGLCEAAEESVRWEWMWKDQEACRAAECSKQREPHLQWPVLKTEEAYTSCRVSHSVGWDKLVPGIGRHCQHGLFSSLE